ALAGKTRGPAGVLAILGAGQLAMHVVLTELMGHMSTSVPMLLAHCAATVITAVLLAHAESMLLAAAATLRLLLPVLWRQAPVPAGITPVPMPAPAAPHVCMLLRRVH